MTSTFAHHTKAFQETGTFEDSLRLKLFCPFLLALHHAHANGFYIMDIKPDNARIREDGSVAFTDLNLGHMFHPVVGRGRRTAQVVPSLLTRRNTTLLAQEHAAAGRQRKVLPKGPFPSPRARPGSQLVSIARAMLRMFWQKASIRGLADLGVALGLSRIQGIPNRNRLSIESGRLTLISTQRSTRSCCC